MADKDEPKFFQNRGPEFLDQADPDDNLISLKMIEDFVKINEKEKPLQFGDDI